MKNLPKIYKQKINKKFTNNSTVYYSTTQSQEKEPEIEDISKFLDDLLKEDGYIFNKPLTIKTKDKTYNTAIVQKKEDKIYTLSDEIIRIKDIISIKKNN